MKQPEIHITRKENAIMRSNKHFTATNFLIFLIILFYLMDRYLIPIPESYSGITNRVEDMPESLAYILGFCGGRLTDLLALCGPELRAGGGAFYRHITVVFTHASLLHLVVNIIPLYLIGNYIERRLGSALVMFIFFLTSFLESFITDPLYMHIDPSFAAEWRTSLNVGSSSGVFGLMGAGFVLCFLNRTNWTGLQRSTKIVLAVYGILTSYVLGLGWSTLCHNISFILGILVMLALYWLSPAVRNRVMPLSSKKSA